MPQDRGATGLGLALRRLPVAGSVLYVTAHPDDENNGVLVKLSRGLGLRVGLLTLTRGEGGQNTIGPELFDAIGILRSEELAAVHRFDGAQQFFSRAKDFGFSFSVEETFRKWDHDEILGDVVRVVRSFRPDVILTLPLEAPGGGQHHQAAAALAKEAFRVAADAARFPEQLREGLRPWQAARIYQGGTGGGGGPQEKIEGAPVVVATNVYDPLLGMSWAEFGSLARASHRCQGTSQLKSAPGEGRGVYYLIDQAPNAAGSEAPVGGLEVLSGIDTSLRGLARFAREGADAGSIASALASLQADAERAQSALDARAPERAAAPLRAGLLAVRALEQRLPLPGLGEEARQELAARLAAKEQDFERALTLALGLVFEASTDDGDVIPGQSFTATTRVWNGGAEPVNLDALSLEVPAGWSARLIEGSSRPLGPGEAAVAKFDVDVSPNAAFSQPYWRSRAKSDRYELVVPEHRSLPWSPADVVARLRYSSGGVAAGLAMPVYKRSEGRAAGGEKQKVVNVVPALAVGLSPRTAVLPLTFAGRPREFRVTVGNNVKGPATAGVSLEAPSGWRVVPASAAAKFVNEGEQVTLRFSVTPPAQLAAGDVELRAVARLGEREYREGYQVIAYDHIQERHLYQPASAVVRVVDVRVAPGANVGYIMGTGDDGPQAIEQLGLPVTLLTADDLAWGDLGRFRTIVTGVRAYESRPELRAYNHRLLSYVERGGHLLVQYNRFEFNQLTPAVGEGGGARSPEGPSPFAPYPAAVTGNRVTVEEAEVRFLAESPVLTGPNRLTAADFSGWVQERGLYFFAPRDPHYRDLLATTDPWPKNPGEKTGLLVEATLGKGTWTYTGLSLFRQLPAGVPGAYRLLANLLSRAAPIAGSGRPRVPVRKGP